MFNYRKFLNNCDALVEDAVEVSMVLMNYGKYENITKSIKNAMWKDYRKNVDVYIYGSRACGLANKSSDLDIFVDIDDKNGEEIFVLLKSAKFKWNFIKG